jgi:U3 small nucleolar RNA-associated protein 13
VHENSVDAICANPQSDKEFATGSHDHTIKLWDAPKYGVKGTIKGHEKGVWALQYDNAGKRLISASPDTTAKIWDIKSGKCADTLKAHTHFVSIQKIYKQFI